MDRRIFATVIVFIFLAVSNYLLLDRINKEEQVLSARQGYHLDQSMKIDEKAKTFQRNKHRYALVPEDPAKYGIVSIPESRLPQTQMEWEIQFDKMLNDSKLMESEAGKKAVEKMNTTQDKYQDTVQKVDKEIALLEQQSNSEPFSQEVASRLQNLYKLKALGKVLENRVVTLPPVPKP